VQTAQQHIPLASPGCEVIHCFKVDSAAVKRKIATAAAGEGSAEGESCLARMVDQANHVVTTKTSIATTTMITRQAIHHNGIPNNHR